ncbi:hypothetical protein MKEN_00809000 [Mycena kentingensis (nom. inval.)]|nr:hypothetical protein MKEN_00809000 [Mycena kentingensis (nom. inval.)]
MATHDLKPHYDDDEAYSPYHHQTFALDTSPPFSSKDAEDALTPVAYPPAVPERAIDGQSFWQRILPESMACRLYVLTVLIETTVDLAIEGELLIQINKNATAVGDNDSVAAHKMPVYLSIFAIAHVFQFVMAVDAVYARNTLQFIFLTVFNALFLVYAVIQIGEIRQLDTSSSTSKIPIDVLTTIIPIVIAISEIAYMALGYKIYHEFGWKVYKFLGADRRIKKLYADYQVYECLVKFDVFFFVGFCVQFLFLVLLERDWEFYVTCAALPLSLILLVEGHLAARHENKWMMATFMSGCAGAMLYFIYKLIKVLRLKDTDDYRLVWKTLTVFSVIAMILLFATIVFSVMILRNFGRGLKDALLNAVRRLLDQLKLVDGVREDISQQVCEFNLGGKPWGSSAAKSFRTEKLLVDLLAVVYQHGYTFLSQIDYGRESDDRLVMAFSRPVSRSAATPSPLSPVDSPIPASISPPNRQGKRIPFALSFISQTTLRVINPPLHSTPAILQAVRGSWPRGVVAEKKVADNCYEFKLKGYKWFQEDNFANDSLRHILALLSSLDNHSFSLLTSISLTTRSRVKDLWVFTGPPSSSVDSLPDSPAPSILNGSANNRCTGSWPPDPSGAPAGVAVAQSAHVRAATTDSPQSATSARSDRRTSLLRKPAPRAQVPVSVHDTDTPMPEPEPLRARMPSVVPGSTENLTGVGAAARTPDVFYSTPPLQQSPPAPGQEQPFPLLLPKDVTRSQTPSSQGQRSSHSAVPSLGDPSHSPSPSSSPQPAMTPPNEEVSQFSPGKESPAGTPPILSPNAFRDSAVSSATTSTYDMPIPIKWTGIGHDSSMDERESVGPTLPGGWQPTPIDEKPEDFVDAEEHPLPTPEIQEVPVRVNSPDHQSPDFELRKSEAGLVGLIAASENSDPNPVPSEGKGWVVVDVEQTGSGSGDASDNVVASPISEPQSPTLPKITSPIPKSDSPAPISPAAKAIAIVDAIESKNKSTTSSLSSKTPENGGGSGGVKKFFSMGRKNSTSKPVSRQPTTDVGASKSSTPRREVSQDDTARAIEMVKGAAKPKSRSTKPSLRERLRLMGTPEASRTVDDKRLSLN